MTRCSLAVASAFAALAVACGGLTAQGRHRFDVELRVHLDQEDREFGGEGYTASYRHRATIGLGGLKLQDDYTESTWKGFETCQDPPLQIDFESEIDFDALRFSEPDLYALRRGSNVWFLYQTARELGVRHPGRPACDAGDGIPPGTWVAKNFFSSDLEEGAAPAGDFPVYYDDEEEAIDGFVLAVIPLSELESGANRTFTTTYEAKSDIFDIGLRVEASVTPR
ncbi:MAG: hypothetical protein ACE5JI_08460 [Acidobacteriota bacterium]